MNYIKNLKAFAKKYDCQTWNAKGVINVKRTNIAYKCKIFEAVNTSWALYACVHSFQMYLHKCRKQNMYAKQGIHKWLLIIKYMFAKFIVHIHITAEVTAYWLVCFTCICSGVEFVCNRKYMCNVSSIFGQGHMALMWNVCTPVFLVTLLIVLSWYEVYILT